MLPLARLLSKVTPGPRPRPDLVGGCWLYTGRPFAKGHGQFSLNGQNVKAHRAAYLLLVGAVVDRHPLIHLCRIAVCISPAHLDPGDGSTGQQRAAAAVLAIRTLSTSGVAA